MFQIGSHDVMVVMHNCVICMILARSHICKQQFSAILIDETLSVEVKIYPDSKVHGAYMGPTWGRQDPGGHHVYPTNLAIWVIIIEKFLLIYLLGVGQIWKAFWGWIHDGESCALCMKTFQLAVKFHGKMLPCVCEKFTLVQVMAVRHQAIPWTNADKDP